MEHIQVYNPIGGQPYGTAPTPKNSDGTINVSDSSNKIATTEWVHASFDGAAVKTINGNSPDAAGNITPAQTGCLPLTGGIIESYIGISKNGLVGILTCSDSNDANYRYTILSASGANAGSFHAFRQDSPNFGGAFFCRATDPSGNIHDLAGFPNGVCTWNNSEVFLPAGAIFAFSGNVDVPGCLICNGAAISRTTYSRLFNVIGTGYGAGDGSTTFNLPNLEGRFIQGSGAVGTYINAGLPNAYADVGFFGGITFGGSSSNPLSFYNVAGSTLNAGQTGNGSVALRLNLSKASSVYGNSTTVQPPALTMRYYIKY